MKKRQQIMVNDASSASVRNSGGKICWFPTWLARVPRSSSMAVLLIFLCIGVGAFVAFVALPLLDSSGSTAVIRNKTGFPLECSSPANITCSKWPSNDSARKQNRRPKQPPICPEYFRWIHNDLGPWRETGITVEMVEAAIGMELASFRLVIVSGKAYLQTYRNCYQTRDVFTQWGILQLLRLYPGQIPDLDLIFNCGDLPRVPRETYPTPCNAQAPPPLFSYDSSCNTSDIIFPDWSFWGWPEINIKPWEKLSKELKEGNEKSKWTDREPYAFWKGNPKVSRKRRDVVKCNVSDEQDWNIRTYVQDWQEEQQQGFRNSNLADQCKHRFKVYIEGVGWSVSEKYILACDSLTLMVKPHFDQFFTRSLMPLKHYWPITDGNNKCRSIKLAVDWGNSHQKEAQAMGKAASKFIQEEVQLKYVYDFMFHLLSQYAKLLRYKPVVPPAAEEVCPESLACPAEGLGKKYMMETLVASSSDLPPCTMPPFDPAILRSFLERKKNAIKQVEMWEKHATIDKSEHLSR